MTIPIAFNPLFVAALLSGVASPPGDPPGSAGLGLPYAPMERWEDSPNMGGMAVGVGNTLKDSLGRRAFLVDAYGNIEVAAQYQVKFPERRPRGEICRLVVQTVRLPGSSGGPWSFDFELPFEPFPVFAGDHLNEVITVKVPAPTSDATLFGAVRIVLEEFQPSGDWEPRAVTTVYALVLGAS